MIRFTVKEVAEREGKENPNQLAEVTGLPYETCRTIWNDTAVLIHKRTLARLCAALRLSPGNSLSGFQMKVTYGRRERVPGPGSKATLKDQASKLSGYQSGSLASCRCLKYA